MSGDAKVACVCCGDDIMGRPVVTADGPMCGDGLGCRRRAVNRYEFDINIPISELREEIARARTVLAEFDHTGGNEGIDETAAVAVDVIGHLRHRLSVQEGGLRQREGDQPTPDRNEQPCIQDMVIADIRARRELGIQRYGTALQPFNGRDAMQDAYDETIDLAQYLKQMIVERDAKAVNDGRDEDSPASGG